MPINWPMPLASTTTSLPAWKSQSFRKRLEDGHRRRLLVGRIDQHQHVPALLQETLEHVGFRLQEVGLRSGDDDDRCIGGHILLLREHDLRDVVVVAGERGLDARCSRRARSLSGISLAVALEEIDLLLVAD